VDPRTDTHLMPTRAVPWSLYVTENRFIIHGDDDVEQLSLREGFIEDPEGSFDTAHPLRVSVTAEIPMDDRSTLPLDLVWDMSGRALEVAGIDGPIQEAGIRGALTPPIGVQLRSGSRIRYGGPAERSLGPSTGWTRGNYRRPPNFPSCRSWAKASSRESSPSTEGLAAREQRRKARRYEALAIAGRTRSRRPRGPRACSCS